MKIFSRIDQLGFFLAKKILDFAYDWFDFTEVTCFQAVASLWLIFVLADDLLLIPKKHILLSLTMRWIMASFVAIAAASGIVCSQLLGRVPKSPSNESRFLRAGAWFILVLDLLDGDFLNIRQIVNDLSNFCFWLMIYIVSADDEDKKDPPGKKRKQALAWLKNLGKPLPQLQGSRS